MFEGNQLRARAAAATAATLLAMCCMQVLTQSSALAAPGDISTIAGTGSPGYSGDGGPATSATLNNPQGVAVDAAGDVFVADVLNHVVRKINPSGNISTVVGTGQDGFSGDGGPATAAEMDQPFGVVLDPAGDLFVSDQGFPNNVRRVDHATGIITTLAGDGSSVSSGDGGPATQAGMLPQFIVYMGGALYIADQGGGNSVRKVDSSGTITAFASGIAEPTGLAADGSGDLFTTSFSGETVDKIDPSGNVTVVAGNGSPGYSGDGGPATSAELNGPYDVALYGDTLYVSEFYNNVVRRVDVTGTITTVAGNGTAGYSGDAGPAASAQLNRPTGLITDARGNLLIGDDGNDAVRKVQGRGPDLLSLSLHGPTTAVQGAAVAYKLAVENDATVGGATGVRVTDTLPAPATFVGATASQGTCTQSSATVTCSVGSIPAGASVTIEVDVRAPTTPTTLSDQAAVTADQTDPDQADNTVSLTTAVINGSGIIYPLAGNGTAGYSGDGGSSRAALLSRPAGIRTDSKGNVYVADAGNNVIRRIDAVGTITTVAGNGTAGYAGDGGPATAAELNGPSALAVDGAGDLFIADSGNAVVREVDPSGMIRTVAGGGASPAATGDGGPATSASTPGIAGVAVDRSGNVYISEDQGVNRIRRVDATTGIITTFKGHLLAPVPPFFSELPSGMTVDHSNHLYVAMAFGSVWRFDLSTGAATVIAGSVNGGGVPSGDGGPATRAVLGGPVDVSLDGAGDLYIADFTGESGLSSNNAIRMVDGHGIISTVAGSAASGYAGDGGQATAALLNGPEGVAAVGHGSFIVSDSGNNALRIVTGSPDLLSLAEVAPLSVPASNAYSYSLRVTNDGSASSATGVVLTDTLPAGLSFAGATSSQGSCTANASTVTCSLGSLDIVSAASVTIDVTAPARSTKVVNTARVAATETEPFTTDDAATATTYVAPADVAVSLVASPSHGADVGAPLSYTATVTNRGPYPAAGVKLSDSLPAGISLRSISVGQGRCALTGAVVGCTLGGLAPGASTTVVMKVDATNPGDVVDTATVSATRVDEYSFDNTASAYLFVSGAGCGRVITRSTTLAADIGPCGGDGVVIGADKIRLDLAGHRIFGRGSGTGFAVTDDLVGIRLPNRTGVTITGGTVSGFDTGIFLNSGLSNVVTGMTLRDNIGQDANLGPIFPDLGDGILIEHSSFNKITSNVVDHNGSYDGIGLFGLDTDGNLIKGNTIENTVSSSVGSDGEGIILNNFLAETDARRGASLSDNNMIGNLVVDNAASGISNVSNVGALIENNTVNGNGLTSFPSNGIGDQVGRVANSDENATISGNHVSGNGDDGIEILAPVIGDKVTGNVVDSNNVHGNGSFNLEDTNGNCTANAWSNNAAANGSVSPACLLPGSSSGVAATAEPSVSPRPGAAASAGLVPQAHRPLLPPITS